MDVASLSPKYGHGKMLGGDRCCSLPTPALSGSGSMGISQQHKRVTPQRVLVYHNETTLNCLGRIGI